MRLSVSDDTAMIIGIIGLTMAPSWIAVTAMCMVFTSLPIIVVGAAGALGFAGQIALSVRFMDQGCRSC